MVFDRGPLEVVEATVTILVDNTVMELIPGSRMINRISKPSASFIAEHGFAALIETEGKKILVDTGATGIALEHNLSLIGLTFDNIDIVFLSHGHNDHTGGLHKVKGNIITHPDVFYERYLETKEGARFDLSSPQTDSFMHKIDFFREPVSLAKGVITTGEIERIHQWEELKIFRVRKNGKIIDDRIIDDQGVIINTRKGLVIIAGCSHAGIVNLTVA
ncbi:MAG: MBL fold metallo-hydrolase [Nitrospirae bacterium]|nr:MBL fold metallo-hydrolase [Nitrospirota bacterium]MCL5421803.1 MBL fold metallo-hydrolase [Nitrospirota bacterium]